jgi:hypothetical protein
MTYITLSQRAQIKERAIELGFPDDVASRICVNASVSVASFDSLICKTLAADFLKCSFVWAESPEEHDFWEKIYFEATERESIALATPKVQKELTQGETQQLLHILREQLEFATDQKDYYKHIAAQHWNFADPDEGYGESAFIDHSNARKHYNRCKAQEKTLVNLITKLKGMR